jgi:hypothetical protein
VTVRDKILSGLYGAAIGTASVEILTSTPKAFANFSPGFEPHENPGGMIPNCDETLKGLAGWRTLSGFNDCLMS